MHDDDDEIEHETQSEQNVRKRALILRCLIEAAYLSAEKPTKQQVINASWRTEALDALMWVLGELANMAPSSDIASFWKESEC